MDQVKIGKFIKEKRKEKNITQSELAEKLNITDRAISKWENGICMPDSSIIPELCQILDITINDLFSGEVVDSKNIKKKTDDNLLELYEQKFNSDKNLLNYEMIFGILSLSFFIVINFIMAYYVESGLLEENKALLIIIPSIIFAIVICFPLLRIEQKTGYYKCNKCHYRYVPKSFFSVFIAPHKGRTRYMKCPKCNRYSWNKKVISKGEK